MKFKKGDRVSIISSAFLHPSKSGIVDGYVKSKYVKVLLDNYKYYDSTHYHGFNEDKIELDNKAINFQTVKDYLGIE